MALSKKNKSKIDKMVKDGATVKTINKAMENVPVVEVTEYVESLLQKTLAIPTDASGKKKGVVIMTQAASEHGDVASKANKSNTLKNNVRYENCITEIKRPK